MATRRYGISVGQTEFQITESAGAAVAANTIELTVDLGLDVTDAGGTRKVKKSEVLLALEMLENHILKNLSGQLGD